METKSALDNSQISLLEDSTIENLIPLLDKGDLIIDGGNSHYKLTQAPTLPLAPLPLLIRFTKKAFEIDRAHPPLSHATLD